MGGVVLYRATAEYSACGRVVDVGPFDMLTTATTDNLPGWLLPTALDGWTIRDRFGTPITICDQCMARPMRDIFDDVRRRRD